MRIFTIKDEKAESFLQPFFAKNSAVALRMIEEAANDTDHNFNKHAEDFRIFEIGGFDEDTGEIDAMLPMSHGLVLDLVHTAPVTTMFEAREA